MMNTYKHWKKKPQRKKTKECEQKRQKLQHNKERRTLEKAIEKATKLQRAC